MTRGIDRRERIEDFTMLTLRVDDVRLGARAQDKQEAIRQVAA